MILVLARIVPASWRRTLAGSLISTLDELTGGTTSASGTRMARDVESHGREAATCADARQRPR